MWHVTARTLHVDTPNNQDYHPLWIGNGAGVTSLVFRLKAGSDGDVYLAENIGVSTADAYQIVIGGHDNTL